MYYFANPRVLVDLLVALLTYSIQVYQCESSVFWCLRILLFYIIFKLFSGNERLPELHSIYFPFLYYFGCPIILFLTRTFLCRDLGAWK